MESPMLQPLSIPNLEPSVSVQTHSTVNAFVSPGMAKKQSNESSNDVNRTSTGRTDELQVGVHDLSLPSSGAPQTHHALDEALLH